MLNIYECTPIVGMSEIYDKISENNIVEIRGLRANNWNEATVLSKHIESNNNPVHIINVYMRKNMYNLVDLNYFQLNYNDSYDFEKNIRYVRTYNPNDVKKIYTYENGKNKEEAITKALLRYGVINNNLLQQEDFRLTTHCKNNRLNGKKYIKLWENNNVIGEFWYKEPNNINNNTSIATWEIDLIKKS